MDVVLTQGQAKRLNNTGMTEPYRAFNGHTMIAPVIFPAAMPDTRSADCGHEYCGRYWCSEVREFRIGDAIRYTSFNAQCTDDCGACHGGEYRPDW